MALRFTPLCPSVRLPVRSFVVKAYSDIELKLHMLKDIIERCSAKEQLIFSSYLVIAIFNCILGFS